MKLKRGLEELVKALKCMDVLWGPKIGLAVVKQELGPPSHRAQVYMWPDKESCSLPWKVTYHEGR